MFAYDLFQEILVFVLRHTGIKALETSKALKLRHPVEKRGFILPSRTVSLALVLISPRLLVAVHS